MEYIFKIPFLDSKLFLIQEENFMNLRVSSVEIQSTANFISVCEIRGLYLECMGLPVFYVQVQKYPKSSRN